MKLRPVVRTFAARMERALAAHDADRGRHGWRQDTCLDLLARVNDEVDELREAVLSRVSRAEVNKEAVDVANFALMVADVFGRKTEVAP